MTVQISANQKQSGMSTEKDLASDLLERQFGPTVVQVLRQNDVSRSICTKVVGTGEVLELSRVIFLQPGMKEFPEVHAAVVAGQSMGKAFKTRDIPFYRQTHATFQCELPGGFYKYFKTSGLASIVDVSILVGHQKMPYARILETYSPAVVWSADVSTPTDDHRRRILLFDDFLRSLSE